MKKMTRDEMILALMKESPKGKGDMRGFVDIVKSNPLLIEKTLEWAKREIAEYQSLIKILEKKL